MLSGVHLSNSHSLSSRPLHSHSALYRVQPTHQHLPHSYNPPRPQIPLENQSHSIYSNSCVPSHLAPPMDPSVDNRAFYAYSPNEVKHRRRTTSSQLKVLEGIFKRDTKPNAALRKELAVQLDMTARGVQVWFQNRRAKEKTKASKASTARKTVSIPQLGKSHTSNHDPSLSPHSSDEKELVPESPSDPQYSSPSHDLLDLNESSSQESSPIDTSPPLLRLNTDSSNTSWQGSPIEPPEDTAFTRRSTNFDDANLIAFRRGSLPVNVFPQSSNHSTCGPPVIDHLDPLARRRSVDASLHRLASNPYAPLARAKNGALFGTRLSAHSQVRHYQVGRPPPYPSQSRPGLPHRASMPHELAALDVRRSSMDSRGFRFSHPGIPASPSPSPLSPYHAVRTSLPEHHLYAISSRTVSSPLPGPLPSPDFSFGAANTPPLASPCSADSDRNSPDPVHGFRFRGDDLETEDDNTSASYDAFSRFGSIASISTSESSAFYSEVGSSVAERELAAGFNPGVRRDSCTSGHFLDLMSGLDVNGLPAHTGLAENLVNPSGQGCYSSREDLAASVTIETTMQSRECNDNTSTYPSPSSTVSPGNSPHVQEGSPPSVPISRSSELAYALQSKPEQTLDTGHESQYVHLGPSPVTEGAPSDPPQDTPYFYSQESTYPQSDASTSSMSLPIEFADKFHFEIPISATGHYQQSYPSSSDGQYPIEGSFSTGESREDVGIHHGMEFAHCTPAQDVYTAYNGDPSTSSIENALHGVESFVTYT